MPQTKAAKGFSLPCIKCGETDCVALYLEDVSTVRCLSCDDEFDLDEVRGIVGRWQAALAWIDTCPLHADPEE